MTTHFFDIGANQGQAFDCYLDSRPKFDGAHIWCFEPSPHRWPWLMSKATAKAGRYQISLCNYGFTPVAGEWPMQWDETSEGDTFLPGVLTHNDTPVRPKKLPYEIRAAGVPLGDFILRNTAPGDQSTVKLDCEGSEYGVLRELLRNPVALARCEEILVEWHKMATFDWEKERDAISAEYERFGMRLGPWGY